MSARNESTQVTKSSTSVPKIAVGILLGV